MCKRRLWKWATLSTGGPTGETGGQFIYQGLFERQMEGSGKSLSMGALSSFTADPEGV